MNIETPKIFKDFEQFIFNANLTSSAFGVVLGLSFGQVVTSLVNDIIMPPISCLLGVVNITNLRIVLRHAVCDKAGNQLADEIAFNYGNFLQITLNFFVIAFSVYLIIKVLKRINPALKTDIKIEPRIK